MLAARLSENPATRVLLLEAGGAEVPGNSLDYVSLWDSPADWAFRTTPQAGLDGVVIVVARSDPAEDPDLQFVFVHFPLPHREPGATLEPWGSSAWRPESASGYSVIFSLQRPRSRGTLTLASPDPTVPPLIDLGYYSDPRDLDLMVTALRRAREMGGTAALCPWRTGELAPGRSVTSDTDLRDYVKLTAGSFAHLVGTCAIGTGEHAVVDPRLRVRGINALRVADASVMPAIVAANTNATVLAIAERAASILTGDERP